MTATETMKLLERLGACDDARKWVEGKTLAEAWANCERGEWMEWLAPSLGVIMTPEALAEYERVKATARAEYERARATAWAEYRRVTVPALAEYERVKATARAEYERARATAYRAAIPWEQIERAAKETK